MRRAEQHNNQARSWVTPSSEAIIAKKKKKKIYLYAVDSANLFLLAVLGDHCARHSNGALALFFFFRARINASFECCV
jgi:hypothetical protein